MKLYFSPTSPFVRKVRLIAASLNMTDEIQIIPTDVYAKNDDYKQINPLIKIPALETREGQILTNSPFICQYLISLKPGSGLWPQGNDLWRALNLQSIADGGMEAAVLRRYESLRTADKFDSSFDQKQRQKILNALEFLERNLAELSTIQMGIAESSALCFVDYLHLRFSKENLGNQFPRLFGWAEKWNSTPWVQKTAPPKA
ncbi:MAG: glutathione S-transferase family protein [Bdellovibrionales bacterium]